tara:strand:- start:51639 stop:52667 length:1029 start_codon:yes stop_codon:yes gene_type:complete
MDLRLVEVVLSVDSVSRIPELLAKHRTLGIWDESLDDAHRLSRILTTADEVEAIVDRVQNAFGERPDLRILVFRVEATIPTPQEDEETEDSDATPQRVSRHELYAAISKSADLSSTFLILIVLSTIVAGIGLIRDSVAIIIGAMVMAPLLGPNVSLALATTLGDTDLAKKSLKTNIVGVGFAFVLACSIGLLFQPSMASEEIASRTVVGMSDPLLALAAGCAGVLAYTTGAPTSLIGVMVAVALLPPLAVSGMMLTGGHYSEAGGAALLVLVNVICVNLAGVVTFLAKGIGPRRWWEADRARRASQIAIVIWLGLLAVLIAIIAGLGQSGWWHFLTHTNRSS